MSVHKGIYEYKGISKTLSTSECKPMIILNYEYFEDVRECQYIRESTNIRESQKRYSPQSANPRLPKTVST